MKLVMTLLVRNEADILSTQIEYHLRRGVDFFIATDNLSTDGTRAILEHYRGRDLLHLIDQPDDNYAQNTWVTAMARMAAIDFQADWVINSDADEFWWPENEQRLSTVLDRVPRDIDAVQVARRNFVPVAHTEDRHFAACMTVREATSLNALGHPLPPKVCHRAYPDIDVAMGNHQVSRATASVTVGDAPLTIDHFPLRSYQQFCRKISLGGAALERNGNLSPDAVGTWRMLYRKWQRGELEAFYRAQEIPATELESGLASQRLIRDERLRDFLRQMQIPE
jgi:hypothetical protein